MAKKRATQKQAKKPIGKRAPRNADTTAPLGGGHLNARSERPLTTDAAARKMLASIKDEVSHTIGYQLMAGEYEKRIRELQTQITEMAERESDLSRREREVRLAAYRKPPFPDDMYDMGRFAHSASSCWHLHTLVSVIINHLVRVAKRRSGSQVITAYEGLAKIARLVRAKPKEMCPQWLTQAMEQPAFLKVWNEPWQAKTRGGTGGNQSTQVIFTFTELTMYAFDKHCEYDSSFVSRRELYSDADKYLKGFLPFAKEHWDDGGGKGAETLTGCKLRTNSGSGERKQSFGHFRDDVERQARRNLKHWRSAFPP